MACHARQSRRVRPRGLRPCRRKGDRYGDGSFGRSVQLRVRTQCKRHWRDAPEKSDLQERRAIYRSCYIVASALSGVFFESEMPKPDQRAFSAPQLDIILYCITHFVNVDLYPCQYSLDFQLLAIRGASGTPPPRGTLNEAVGNVRKMRCVFAHARRAVFRGVGAGDV